MNSFLLYALCFAIVIAIVHFKFNLTPPLFGSILIGFWIIKMKFHRRFGIGITCFKNPKPNSKAEIDVDAELLEVPPHLVIMVNGIVGSSADWRFAAEQFLEKLPDKVIVHRSECNSSKLTFDGVDTMGERLAEEVLSVVSRWPGLKKISFVAHSLGGLVARYAIARLFEYSSTLESEVTRRICNCKEETECTKNCIEQNYEARIAGLEPMNFITFATPHLGSRGNKQLPFLCGLAFLERRASQTAHLVVGRTGKHLFLMDNDDGKPPLLLRMIENSDDLKFMSALRAFKRRVAYANANFDHMVGWRTSSIRRQHELPTFDLQLIDEKYPHIVHAKVGTVDDLSAKESTNVGDQTIDTEEEMIRGLTQVPWERVDVSFRKSKQRYVAHSTIQVKTYWLHSDGSDVIFHMIDKFLI
ncbi:putative lipase C4A8.10 [Lathyrus oleraceus]|uniref:DUF676 domain-containing protein n=1 Tax=Pisum sativum TaxID=3888 RepID=A0A9D5AK17_PEA|nr:putative lipase C4A8.10 [Pisum sativum]KAI5414907.1 hypothetical protein KIW84_040388 [Pisum sativum]